MVIIEPLGTDVLLPAFVVGYELKGELEYDHVAQWDASPDWIVTLDQQAGGHAMLYPQVAGIVLRFTDNKDRIGRNADFLIRGFRAMAEDPDYGLLQSEYPVLRRLCGTRSKYSVDNLREIEEYLSGFLTTPPVESGYEAFIQFVPCNILQYFVGWKLLQVKVLPMFQQVYLNQVCPRAEQGNLNGLAFRSEEALDADKMGVLEQLGKFIGQSQLKVFLLGKTAINKADTRSSATRLIDNA